MTYRLKEDKQKKRYSLEEGFDVTPPNLSPSSPEAHDFGSSQLDSSDALISKKVRAWMILIFYLMAIVFLTSCMSSTAMLYQFLFFRRMI